MPQESTEILISILLGAAIILIILSFLFIIFIMYFKRKIKYAKEKQLLQSHFQQTLLQTQLEIQEQTLKTISQEIHDNIGQVLSLAKLNINTMDCDKPRELQEKIRDSKHLISKAIQDLRDLSKSLNTDYVIEMGLTRSIEYELEMIKKTGSFETQLHIEGQPFQLEQQQELIIFRIVQEALHNIIKHARASVIEVQLKFDTTSFVLIITDNGAGFDASQLDQNNYNGFGMGIRNMYNRARLINTSFTLKSILKEGTTITLALPLSTNKL